MYPKMLQDLMSHSNISVTMNTYTHLKLEDAVDEMNRMQRLESARKEQEALVGETDVVKLSKKHFRAGSTGFLQSRLKRIQPVFYCPGFLSMVCYVKKETIHRVLRAVN